HRWNLEFSGNDRRNASSLAHSSNREQTSQPRWPIHSNWQGRWRARCMRRRGDGGRTAVWTALARKVRYGQPRFELISYKHGRTHYIGQRKCISWSHIEGSTCMEAPPRVLGVSHPKRPRPGQSERIPLLQLLLTAGSVPCQWLIIGACRQKYSRAELRRVAASPLAAVGRTGRKTSVALAANLLVAVVF
ncbi:hypothetical protein BV20DRAFT_1082499, partial [Pilatotrama ljubarskyi]